MAFDEEEGYCAFLSWIGFNFNHTRACGIFLKSPKRGGTMSEKNFFTVVFRGDIREFDGNPLKTDTPFGVPVRVGIGDAFAELEEIAELEDVRADEAAGMARRALASGLPALTGDRNK